MIIMIMIMIMIIMNMNDNENNNDNSNNDNSNDQFILIAITTEEFRRAWSLLSQALPPHDTPYYNTLYYTIT